MISHPVSLCETLENKPCFTPLNKSIRFVLNSEYLLRFNDIFSRRNINKFSSPILFNNSHFFFHGFLHLDPEKCNESS